MFVLIGQTSLIRRIALLNMKNFFQSKFLQGIIFGLGLIIILLLVFKAGMMVGMRKAKFSYGWGENYHRNFGGPKGGFLRDSPGRDFIDANGTVGQIIKIDGQTVVVKGRDNVEKIILAQDDTTINRGRENIKLADLKIDDYIVTIGQPNSEGQIKAKLIRVMPNINF